MGLCCWYEHSNRVTLGEVPRLWSILECHWLYFIHTKTRFHRCPRQDVAQSFSYTNLVSYCPHWGERWEPSQLGWDPTLKPLSPGPLGCSGSACGEIPLAQWVTIFFHCVYRFPSLGFNSCTLCSRAKTELCFIILVEIKLTSWKFISDGNALISSLLPEIAGHWCWKCPKVKTAQL